MLSPTGDRKRQYSPSAHSGRADKARTAGNEMAARTGPGDIRGRWRSILRCGMPSHNNHHSRSYCGCGRQKPDSSPALAATCLRARAYTRTISCAIFPRFFCCLNVGRRPGPVNQCNTDSVVGACPTRSGRAAPTQPIGQSGRVNRRKRGIVLRFPTSSDFGRFPPAVGIDDLYLRLRLDSRKLEGVFDGVVSQTETRQRGGESRFIDVPAAVISPLHGEEAPSLCLFTVVSSKPQRVTACTSPWRHECTRPSRHPTWSRTFPSRPCIAHPSCLPLHRPSQRRTCVSLWRPRRP